MGGITTSQPSSSRRPMRSSLIASQKTDGNRPVIPTFGFLFLFDTLFSEAAMFFYQKVFQLCTVFPKMLFFYLRK